MKKSKKRKFFKLRRASEMSESDIDRFGVFLGILIGVGFFSLVPALIGDTFGISWLMIVSFVIFGLGFGISMIVGIIGMFAMSLEE